jgi:hypothetical protein
MDSASGDPLAGLLHDLQGTFGPRLNAFVTYGHEGTTPLSSLAIVESLTHEDLSACARHAKSWHGDGAATPLILTRDEFAGSLDAFPIEYGEILDTYRLLHGADPFTGLAIRPEDLRRACEGLAKSHLLHLRENYMDGSARPAAVSALVAESAPAFATLLRRLARLDGSQASTPLELGRYAASRPGLDARIVGDVFALGASGDASGVDPLRLFPEYLAAAEQLARFVDAWREM